jgi:hypothetical protein
MIIKSCKRTSILERILILCLLWIAEKVTLHKIIMSALVFPKALTKQAIQKSLWLNNFLRLWAIITIQTYQDSTIITI